MEQADKHLETMLEELNERVNALESSGDREQLLEAYVNRGVVLSMMDYRTSALDDLDSAVELEEELSSEGVPVDAGTYVKMHVTAGSLIFDQDGDPVEEYYLAAQRLGELRPGSMHYDARGIIRMCISVSENLIDSEHPEDAEPFLKKGIGEARAHDQWTRNRLMQLHSLSAEAADAQNDVHRSVEEYTKAIELGLDLLERGILEDPDDLILVLAMRASNESDLGMIDECVDDLTAAVSILESMMENHMLRDKDPLITLHHDLASALIKAGRVEEAEQHMIRAMEISVVDYAGSVEININTQQKERPRPLRAIPPDSGHRD